VSVDPRFERSVLAEFALSERRSRRRDGPHGARLLALRLHRGRDELLAHLERVAQAVPKRFRAVAWLHHAHEVDVASRALAGAGVTDDEVTAIELFACGCPLLPRQSVLGRARALSAAPGAAGYLARVVARAAIQDQLNGARPDRDTLAALLLLPDPRLAGAVGK
jgi:hypothetical protein